MSGPKKCAHMGEVVRVLRQAAGLTRMQLGEGTKVGVLALRDIELRRRLPTRAQMDQLLTAPAMENLLALCDLEGVKVEIAEDPPGTGSGPMSGTDPGGTTAAPGRGGKAGDGEGGSGGSGGSGGVGGAP